MDNLVKLLDKNLHYIKQKIEGDTVYLYVMSNRLAIECPFCGTPSVKKHSTYERTFQDLPIQDKKVIIVLKNRKMFCKNEVCSKKTFAERFSFLNFKSKKTNRLEDMIREYALNCSTVSASAMLKRNVAEVSRTTISNLLKKQI